MNAGERVKKIDLSEYKTASGMAKAIGRGLVEYLELEEEQVLVLPPGHELNESENCWYVCCEAGPFEWVHQLCGYDSWLGFVGQDDNPRFYLEPYYSFALVVAPQ